MVGVLVGDEHKLGSGEHQLNFGVVAKMVPNLTVSSLGAIHQNTIAVLEDVNCGG